MCTQLPHCYLTLHPGLLWWNRESQREISEKKFELDKVAASTVRKRRRMPCLHCVRLVIAALRQCGLLQPQPWPHKLWVTLGKPFTCFLLQLLLSVESSFPLLFALSLSYVSKAEERNLSTMPRLLLSLQIKAGFHPTCSEFLSAQRLPCRFSQSDLAWVLEVSEPCRLIYPPSLKANGV